MEIVEFFKQENVEKDDYALTVLSQMLTHEYYRVGRLLDTPTLSVLLEKLNKSYFEVVKFLPSSGLHIIRTQDLGYGYSSYLSPAKLNELMQLGKVQKDLSIEFDYKWGNLTAYISIEDINPDVFLTDEVYFFVQVKTKSIYCSVIGKPTAPNILYYKEKYSGYKTTLDKALTIKNFNRINIREKALPDFV